MLDECEDLKHLAIIGVGGVSDEAGFNRMISAGADAVALATALGVEGMAVFKKIVLGAAISENVANDELASKPEHSVSGNT